MALTCNLILDSGLSVNAAYSRIETIIVKNNANLEPKARESSVIYVNFYPIRQSYLDGKAEISRKAYSFYPDPSDSTLNIEQQAYRYLKTLPEFSDAINA